MDILYAESHAIFARTVTEQFLSAHDVTHVMTVAAAIAALGNSTKSFDVLLLDYDLDDAKGDQLIRSARELQPNVKIIATCSNDRAQAALTEAGADAITRKLQFDSVPALIEKLSLNPTPSHSAPTASRPPVQFKTPKQIVHAWVDAFNRADIDALTNFYAPDATNHQVAESPVAGAEAIRAMFTREFAAAEMVCIVENIFEDGQWAILEWRDPKGVRGCGFFQVVNEKIICQRGYWDKLTFLKSRNLA